MLLTAQGKSNVLAAVKATGKLAFLPRSAATLSIHGARLGNDQRRSQTFDRFVAPIVFAASPVLVLPR